MLHRKMILWSRYQHFHNIPSHLLTYSKRPLIPPETSYAVCELEVYAPTKFLDYFTAVTDHKAVKGLFAIELSNMDNIIPQMHQEVSTLTTLALKADAP